MCRTGYGRQPAPMSFIVMGGMSQKLPEAGLGLGGYSMTWSAVASSVGEIVTPRAFAVFRFITI